MCTISRTICTFLCVVQCDVEPANLEEYFGAEGGSHEARRDGFFTFGVCVGGGGRAAVKGRLLDQPPHTCSDHVTEERDPGGLWDRDST